MIAPRIITIFCISFGCIAAARSLAEPAIQYLSPRDSAYQGGWPLGLSTSSTNTCPANSVACSTANVNPECCPAGNTCVWGPSQFQNYCCPSSSDCNEAVVNFPRCAFDNQTMFVNSPGGYFCCNVGELGVIPLSGKPGGLCEPSDQVFPTSLLATKIAQVGIATPSPTLGTAGSNNATTTTGSGGPPAETNPSSAPTSTASSDPIGNTTSVINKWPLATKIGIAAGIFVGFILLCVVSSILRSRRRRIRGVIPGTYAYGSELGEFDEYGNRINVYETGYRARLGYERYRTSVPPTAPANNVTVNVVHGDQTQ